MNKQMMLSCLLMILSTISWAMDTVPASNDNQPGIVVVFCKNQENKAYEDRWMYEYSPSTGHTVGMFDGHTGLQTSDYLSKNFSSHFSEQKSEDVCVNLSKALLDADEVVKKFKSSGSTAIVVNIVNRKCHFANVGDSRAALGRIVPEGKHTISFVTKDHVPAIFIKDSEPIITDEGYRIWQAGGSISIDYYVYAHSLSGGLAVTRSIGDHDEDPEKSVVLATPECTTCDISDVSDEDYLVLGSDGLWDYLNQDGSLSEHAFAEYAFSKMSSGVADGTSLVDIGVSMVADAVRNGSTDDITCMLVKIKALMESKKATVQSIHVGVRKE